MPDTDDIRDAHGGQDADGNDDAHSYGTFGDNPGVQHTVLRYIHRHSEYDPQPDAEPDEDAHAHQHTHGGLKHGHLHVHGDKHIQHHPLTDHDAIGEDQVS